jgi:hypothetical protein
MISGCTTMKLKTGRFIDVTKNEITGHLVSGCLAENGVSKESAKHILDHLALGMFSTSPRGRGYANKFVKNCMRWYETECRFIERSKNKLTSRGLT